MMRDIIDGRPELNYLRARMPRNEGKVFPYVRY